MPLEASESQEPHKKAEKKTLFFVRSNCHALEDDAGVSLYKKIEVSIEQGNFLKTKKTPPLELFQMMLQNVNSFST